MKLNVGYYLVPEMLWVWARPNPMPQIGERSMAFRARYDTRGICCCGRNIETIYCFMYKFRMFLSPLLTNNMFSNIRPILQNHHVFRHIQFSFPWLKGMRRGSLYKFLFQISTEVRDNVLSRWSPKYIITESLMPSLDSSLSRDLHNDRICMILKWLVFGNMYLSIISLGESHLFCSKCMACSAM